MTTHNCVRESISGLLESLRAGATLSQLARENNLADHTGIIWRLRHHCDPLVYREALIAGLHVRLKTALEAGETKRYRAILDIAARRYPSVFVFPRKQRGKTVDIRTVAAVSHLDGESGSE